MIIHVVQRGETLWRLSQRYGVTIQQIVTANGLENPNQLPIGMALVIPTSYRMHTVRYGETLWQIASYYGVTVSEIVRANQISNPSLIYPGTNLIIPERSHTVKAGETLWQIAQAYNTTVRDILKINPISNPNLIFSGTVLKIPFPKPTIEVNSYTINQGEIGANEVREVGDLLTYSCPFAYVMTENGDILPIHDAPIIAASLAHQVAPMMCLTNFTYQDPGSLLAHTILTNVQLQERLLNNILTIMKEKGYLGLNVDFENVYHQDRELYNQFLRRTVDKLHANGYFVSTAVAPKTSGEQKGLLYEAHDYAAHGEIVDFIILMTYEWGYRKGPPQAISPLNQIRKVLDYAISVILKNKIFMGFQIYARDWLLPHVQGQEAETFSQQEAIRRAVKYGATIQYDTLSQSPYFTYRDEQGRDHIVWFEDARSAQAKFDTVKEYGLRGISYWTLGYPFPQNWVLLNDNFSIRKII